MNSVQNKFGVIENHRRFYLHALISCLVSLFASTALAVADIHQHADEYVAYLNSSVAGTKTGDIYWLERAALVSPLSGKNNPFLNKEQPREIPSYLKPSIILTYVIHDPDTVTALKENLPEGKNIKNKFKTGAMKKYCQEDKSNPVNQLLENGYSITEQYETEKAWYLFGYKITLEKCKAS